MSYQLLIVDDSSEFNELVELALEPKVRSGEFSLLFARDGVEALQCIADHPAIELVITDISMPQMDGLTLLDQINTYNPHIKSIVISGHSDLHFIRRAMNAGASDYLVKPVGLDDLLHAIDKAASRVDIVREALRSRDQLKFYERELKIAYDIQQEMLPRKFPAFPELSEIDIDGGMLPARHVGGDFYDFFLIDDDYLGFVVGDVSGKGVSAALLMAQVRTLIRSTVLQGCSASETLAIVNNMIAAENRQAMFATVFLGILELSSGVVEYCNAAHVNPIQLYRNNSVRECEPTNNMAVGMIANMPYDTRRTVLQPGESMVVVTDGVTEAMNAQGQMFGMEGLLDAVRTEGVHNAHEIMMHVVERVNKYTSGTIQSDDIGILVIQYRGRES